MKTDATNADVDNTIAIYPTSSEELGTMKQPVSTPLIDNVTEWKQVG